MLLLRVSRLGPIELISQDQAPLPCEVQDRRPEGADACRVNDDCSASAPMVEARARVDFPIRGQASIKPCARWRGGVCAEQNRGFLALVGDELVGLGWVPSVGDENEVVRTWLHMLRHRVMLRELRCVPGEKKHGASITVDHCGRAMLHTAYQDFSLGYLARGTSATNT